MMSMNKQHILLIISLVLVVFVEKSSCLLSFLLHRRDKFASKKILHHDDTFNSFIIICQQHHHLSLIGLVGDNNSPRRSCHSMPRLSITALKYTTNEDSEDQQRLLLTEPAISAYLQAEIETWLLESSSSILPNPDSEQEKEAANTIAVDVANAYQAAHKAGILSHHGSLISFISSELRQEQNLSSSSAFTCLNTNAYNVAKRTVDLLHHLLYRGTYTTTITPIGVGNIAAREAVGLSPTTSSSTATHEKQEHQQDIIDDEDSCLVEAPKELTETDCLWTESDDIAWRQRRFEKITMEGWRDPRRGNSGTSR